MKPSIFAKPMMSTSIPQTTEEEARQMTACPACGAHKGIGPRVCNSCLSWREDIMPLTCTPLTFNEWLAYALSGRQVVTVDHLLEPEELK
jgi:hypothetical protein